MTPSAPTRRQAVAAGLVLVAIPLAAASSLLTAERATAWLQAGVASVSAMAVLALGGCARVAPGAGFPDVQKLAMERTGLAVHWNQGTPEDRAVAGKILNVTDFGGWQTGSRRGRRR